MKRALACSALLLALTACTTRQPTPDEIRDKTAQATREAVQDTKAVAQGVVDGVRRDKGPVNINSASEGQLTALPGIDSETAQRIIANRPYQDSSQLLRRHLVTREEYDRISTRITAQ